MDKLISHHDSYPRHTKEVLFKTILPCQTNQIVLYIDHLCHFNPYLVRSSQTGTEACYLFHIVPRNRLDR